MARQTLWAFIAFAVLFLNIGCSPQKANEPKQKNEPSKDRSTPKSMDSDQVKILENADHFELNGVSIKEPEIRTQVVNAIYQSVEEGASPAFCFDPGLFLRARMGERTVDLDICFHCSQMRVFFDGSEMFNRSSAHKS